MFNKVKKSKVSTASNSTALNARRDNLRALPRSAVSEPTRSPYVVWSTKHKIIVSEHSSKQAAVSALSKLRKEIKTGMYD